MNLKQWGTQRSGDRKSRAAQTICAAPIQEIRPPISGLREFDSGDDGMMALVNVVTVAFLALLVGFVGNVGRMVQEKIAVQTAADATAYSASLVMARGMNAVTATNHLMGEATALVVLLDALGVPEHGASSSSAQTGENRRIELDIRGFAPKASNIDISDESLIEKGIEQISDQNHPVCGAMVYDSTLMLRQCFRAALQIKCLANLILGAQEVPTVGAVAMVVGNGMHLAADTSILQMIEEAYVLNFIDQLLPNLVPVRDGLARVVIPAMSSYADSLVGHAGSSTAAAQAPGAIRKSIEHTIDRMRREHAVSETMLFPAPGELRLPIVPEPPPQNSNQPGAGGGSVQPVRPKSTWTGNDKGAGFGYDALVGMISWFTDARSLVAEARDFLDKSSKYSYGVSDFELGTLRFFVDNAAPYLDDLKIEPPRNDELGGCGFGENPTRNALQKLPADVWAAECRTQWVRATYPAVDSLRAPFRKMLRQALAFSHASTFFVNWTNRFTLEASWELRSGYPDKMDSKKNGDDRTGLLRVLDLLTGELRKLRHDFDYATDGPGALAQDREIPENAYSAISEELSSLVDHILKTEHQIESLLNRYSFLLSWFKDVQNHKSDIETFTRKAKAGAAPSANELEGDFTEVLVDLYRVEKLDELLRALEEILGRLGDLANLFELPTPHVYVMLDSDPASKGHEIWTVNSRLAEKRFTVLAMAHRAPHSALFGGSLFRLDSNHGVTATAEAMYYNANGSRVPDKPSKDSKTQPDTGWDTLNWNPPVTALEWGDSTPTEAGGDPSALLEGAFPPPAAAKIKLNWQAKLVPVTMSRLRDARKNQSWRKFNEGSVPDETNESRILRH